MIEKITVKGKDYTLDEARELWADLNQIFGTNPYIYPPLVSPVSVPYYTWPSVTTGDITITPQGSSV